MSINADEPQLSQTCATSGRDARIRIKMLTSEVPVARTLIQKRSTEVVVRDDVGEFAAAGFIKAMLREVKAEEVCPRR